MTQAMTVEEFARVVLTQARERIAVRYSQAQADAHVTEVIPGRVYAKVDLGVPRNDDGHPGEGKFMVENATGNIYGIKAYGKVHKGHFYGTLATVDDWYWGEYYPVRREGKEES